MKRRDHQEKNYAAAAAMLSIDCVSGSNPPPVSCFLTEPVIRTSKKKIHVWYCNGFLKIVTDVGCKIDGSQG